MRLLAENEVIVEEKKALLAQIEKEQGNLSQYHERQSKCNSEKADLEIALTQAQQKLADTEQARIQVSGFQSANGNIFSPRLPTTKSASSKKMFLLRKTSETSRWPSQNLSRRRPTGRA